MKIEKEALPLNKTSVQCDASFVILFKQGETFGQGEKNGSDIGRRRRLRQRCAIQLAPAIKEQA